MRRTTCGACGHDELEPFLDLGQSPVADAYTTSPDEVSPTYPLQVAVCTGCWLVQLLDVVDHDVLFGTGYSFYSSASAPLSAYHSGYADDVLIAHGPLAKRLTVEVGCNDGDLLRHFAAAGCSVLGVDPASGPASIARDRGLDVLVEPFGRTVAERIRDGHGPAGVVVANHVLAHVESVADVLDGIQHLLAPDGVAWIEIQYLPDLLVNNAFDLVYHEHRNFFSLTALEAAAGRWGLHVVDAQLTDRQGGSLRVAVARHTAPHPGAARIRASETWLRGIEAYRGFQGRADRIRDRLTDLIYQHADGRIVGYGAPAKATTLLNFCRIDSDLMDVVIDTTPAKQGRYIPGTGALIVDPGDVDLRHVDTMLLLSWNYAPQIVRNHLGWMTTGGRWVIPIPSPVVM